VYAATNFVQRLEMTHKLEFHNGCVNALGFNSSGQILASGSDDLKVALWDWARNKLVHHYKSGHSSNIFQVGVELSARVRVQYQT
jgi:WD repeat-containing protein 42A